MRRDLATRKMRWLWLLVPPALIATASWIDAGFESADAGRWTVTIVDRHAIDALYGLALASAAVLVVLRRRRRHAFPRGAATIGLTVLALAATRIEPFGSPWRLTTDAVGPDGRTYAHVEQAEFTGGEERLGRLTARGLVWRTFESLATATTGSPGDDCFAYVIRPAGSIAARRAIFFAPDGEVVVTFDGRVFVAASPDGRRVFAMDTVGDLSPFVLLDATATGEPLDLDDVVAAVARAATLGDGPRRSRVPRETSLVDALDHANPWVGAAARRIVEAGGVDLYPAAMRRLATTR
jgi:hypothetical protein